MQLLGPTFLSFKKKKPHPFLCIPIFDNFSQFLIIKKSTIRINTYTLTLNIKLINKLKRHERVYHNHDYCHVDMLEEGKNILKYHHGDKSLPVPFIIYADLEFC